MLYKSILNFLRRSGSKLSAPRIQRLRAGFRLLDNRLTPSPVGLFPSSTIHRVSESGGGPLRARALVATEDGEDNPVPEGRRQDYAEAMRGERTTPPGRPKKKQGSKNGTHFENPSRWVRTLSPTAARGGGINDYKTCLVGEPK